jgi:hypothetical protein
MSKRADARARKFRQLELFEPGPALCEWCGAATGGRPFCDKKCRTDYERKHGKIARQTHGVRWAPAATLASSATSTTPRSSSSSPATSPATSPRPTSTSSTRISTATSTAHPKGYELFRAWQNHKAPEWVGPVVEGWLASRGLPDGTTGEARDLFRNLERVLEVLECFDAQKEAEAAE